MKRRSYQELNAALIIIALLIGIIIMCVMMWSTSNVSLTHQVTGGEQHRPRTITTEEVSELTYTEDELFCMAAAIYNEAGGDNCSDDTRRLVGYVILNRVNDSRFPNTIREVLEQKRQYGRFHWTGIKFADRASLPQEQRAVSRAYNIARECLKSKSIPIPSNVVFQAEFEQGVGVFRHQEEMYFCYAKEVK